MIYLKVLCYFSKPFFSKYYYLYFCSWVRTKISLYLFGSNSSLFVSNQEANLAKVHPLGNILISSDLWYNFMDTLSGHIIFVYLVFRFTPEIIFQNSINDMFVWVRGYWDLKVQLKIQVMLLLKFISGGWWFLYCIVSSFW